MASPPRRRLVAAALNCELVLVRIDPGCFFHLNTIIRLARGDIEYTDSVLVRLGELTARTVALDDARSKAVKAYKAAFADLSDNEVAILLRKKTKADLDAIFVIEKELAAVSNRFNTYQKELGAIAGGQVIVNTLVWESGYPLDSLSEFATIVDRLSSDLPPRIVKPLRRRSNRWCGCRPRAPQVRRCGAGRSSTPTATVRWSSPRRSRNPRGQLVTGG